MRSETLPAVDVLLCSAMTASCVVVRFPVSSLADQVAYCRKGLRFPSIDQAGHDRCVLEVRDHLSSIRTTVADDGKRAARGLINDLGKTSAKISAGEDDIFRAYEDGIRAIEGGARGRLANPEIFGDVAELAQRPVNAELFQYIGGGRRVLDHYDSSSRNSSFQAQIRLTLRRCRHTSGG